MIPAVALADEAEDVQTSDDALQLLALSPNEAWAAGEIAAKDNTGATTYDATAIAAGITFKADGKAHYVVPTAVSYNNGEIEIAINDKDFTLAYQKYDTAQSKFVDVPDLTTISTKGSYKVIVTPAAKVADGGTKVFPVKSDGTAADTGDDVANTKEIPFSITETSLEGAYVYEKGASTDKTSDKVFDYTGADQLASVQVADKSGKTLTEQVGATAADYKVAVFAKGAALTAANEIKAGNSTAALLNAGEYVAAVYGASDAVGTATPVAQLPFTINAIDLSTATITVKQDGNDVVVDKINGKKLGSDATALKVTMTDGPAATISTAGTYTFSVTKASPQDENYTGTGTATYDKATNTIDENYVFYSGNKAANVISAKLPDSGTNKGKWVVNHADGDADFDPAKVQVYTDYYVKSTAGGAQATDAALASAPATTVAGHDIGDSAGTKLTASQFSVEVKDKDGNTADPTKPGTYTVTIKVNAAATSYKQGGEISFPLVVSNGELTSANVVAKFDGKIASAIEKTYTGKDLLPRLAVTVSDADGKALAQGTDYKLVVTNKAGDEVDKIVDADDYTVTIEGITYDLKDTIAITVKDIDVTTGVKAGNTATIAEYNSGTKQWTPIEKAYAYTGEAITPTVQYATIDEDGEAVLDGEGNAVYAELPADAYTLTFNKTTTDNGTAGDAVKEIKAEGWYMVTVSDANSKDSFNIDGTQAKFYVKVTKQRTYKDVPADAWFNDSITEATQAGYMSGYSGTDLFGPYDKMTRGQVAVVLFRMAGNDTKTETDGSANENISYPTKFTDVDAKAYYAQAIQWASQRGIVTGYSDTKFGPEDAVTREQFAVMLSRYEKAANGTLTSDAAALDAYTDKGAVHSWATEAVAWAVGGKIMGKDTTMLTPTKDITRAEAAAMLVRYQPLEA